MARKIIALAADHGGFILKEKLKKFLKKKEKLSINHN